MSDDRGAGAARPGDDGDGNEGGTDDDGVPLVEQAVMVSSALFTLALFVFAVWQAFAGAGAAAPEVGVIGHHTASDGDVVYTVELRNPGDVGLVQVTVAAGCTDPPVELAFENVPAGGRRVGTIACPPGTADPRVSIASWIRE